MTGISMKRVVVILIPLFLILSDLKADDEIRLSGIKNYHSDISLRVIAKAYSRIGRRVVFDALSAERALTLSNLGRYDGELHRIKGVEAKYPNLVRVPVPVNHVEVVVFSRRFDFRVDGWESLAPYSIITRKGIKVFEYNTQKMNVTLVYNTEDVFQQLDYNRYDIAVETKITGLIALKKLGLRRIKFLNPSLVTVDLFHYLHKKNKNLLPEMARVLNEMKRRGEIERIRRDYVSELELDDL